MTRDQLVRRLSQSSGAPREDAEPAPLADEPLPSDPAAFWNGLPLPDDSGSLFGEVRTPPVAVALLKRLGTFPFWRGAESPQTALEPMYARASVRGAEVFAGEWRASTNSEE